MATECPLCGDEYKIVTSHISRSHTDKEYKSVLLKELKRLSNEYDKTPTSKLMDSEGDFSKEPYKNFFNSWNEALEEAELEVNQKKGISKNRLLEELERLADEYDKTPSAYLMRSKGKFSTSTYERTFGSWNNALKEAGLELNNEVNISKDRLLEELQRLADEYGRTLTQSLMKSEGKFSPDTYKNFFDSWNKALKKAGLEVNKERNISKNRLLEELERLADEYDKTPSAHLMRSEGKFSPQTYFNSFGSWNKALKKAGLEVNKERNISKNRLLEELERLADEYNKTPSKALMESEGKFCSKTYQEFFSSWNNAVKEAGLELNNGSMCGMEQAVYVLDCRNSKYYIGASAYPDKRLREHKNQGRRASSWTREHGVKERIYLSEPMPHEEAYQKEREKTLELMRKHGWENVRGSCWLSVEFESPPKPLEMNQKI